MINEENLRRVLDNILTEDYKKIKDNLNIYSVNKIIKKVFYIEWENNNKNIKLICKIDSPILGRDKISLRAELDGNEIKIIKNNPRINQVLNVYINMIKSKNI